MSAGMPEPSSAANSRRAAWRSAALTPARNEVLAGLRRGEADTVPLAIFSSTTWRPLAPFLEGELRVEGVHPECRFHEYGAIETAGGGGTGGEFRAAILAVDDAASYGPLYDPSVPFGEDEERPLLDALLARVDRIAEIAPRLLVSLPPAPPRLPQGLGSGTELGVRVSGFAARLAGNLALRKGVEAFSIDAAIAGLGDRARDARLRHLGKIAYSEAGFLAIATELAPRILLHAGKGIKAVIVDLDNTLWGGLAGEDGLQGVALGGDYPGSCFREVQEELLRWKRSGILLAAASKNNPADALAVLDGHPDMLLRSDRFDHLEIHWEPKAASIARILEVFGIGADAVLFVDDNPVERREAAERFPNLRVLDLPDDPIGYADALRGIPWPLFAAGSAEDLRRSELQEQQKQRQVAAGRALSREEYLSSLGIALDVMLHRPEHAPRIAQLHAKTNQFNLDPRRLTEREILDAMEDPSRIVLAVQYSDRFGDSGLVGAAVARLDGGVLSVETFLLSCRVIGLGVEDALLDALVRSAPAEVGEVHLPYRPTSKNAPACQFLSRLGPAGEGQCALVLPRDRVPPPPSWIAVRRSEEVSKEAAVHAQ